MQVLVVGFDQPSFSGEVVAEFARLRDAGIVRLVDMLVVSRTAEDTFEALDLAEGPEADLGEVAASILGQPENSAAIDRQGAEVDTASTCPSLMRYPSAAPPLWRLSSTPGPVR